ncbi:hypothetical protein KC19_9G027500 [Ceratodon purpureus]|uniref:Protein kinase domain-containing protein n=1 Tax=Ceratodon purpureus TaxID=3225 RepID=A0A8T0GQW3_CERPU|nr:hypothetical protein KC19_9G027500 [Ceratodon purpureus]
MAEFLRLAGDAVKMRETAIQADDSYFLFNEAQCRQLWQNLSAASCAFVPSVTYSLPVQQKCLPLYKEFYNIVLRADEIAEKCSDKESWLKQAIFLGGNRQVFQELSADLQSCMRNFHYLTKSLYLDSQIPAPSSAIDVAIPEAESDEDLHKLDVTSLMRRLKEREVDYGEQEKHLASYIVERGIFHRVLEPEPDILDPAKQKKLLFYEVHREDPVHVKNVAGDGSGIVVSEVKWLGLTCAMKEFLNMESTVDFVKEVSALAALSHSRTVKLLCSKREVPSPYIIMELMPMNLNKYCERKDAADSMRFEILPSINMMLQISSGMEYLHDNGVVHRDLKSLNILVRELHHRGLCSEGYDVDVKLTDFGLAKMEVPEKSMEATCKRGTTKWSAPEVLGIPPNPPKPRIDWRKADTYSFAVVCSEILTGQTPYSGIWEFQRSIDRVISGDLRPELPQDCPIYLREFLSRCWAHNPKDRPTFKEITQTLSEFKTSLQIGTVPELTRVRKVSLLMGLMTFLGVRKNDAYVRPQVWCPDSKERTCFEAAVEYIFGRMEIMEALCSEMKEHQKMVEICHVQCDHLVKSYLEGFQKVRAVLKHVSPKDFWNLYTSEKLKKFSESMDGLICSTMAVAEVVRACGRSEWMITALTIFTVTLPEASGHCSFFGQHLWNLYWNLFVMNHAMHDVTARQPSTSLQLLSTSSTLRVQWCEERCKLVLQTVTSTGLKDGDGEFLQADAGRRAEDRKNLIMSLSLVKDSPVSWFALICSSLFLSPVVPFRIGPPVFLRERLESTSDPRDLDSYKIDDLKLEAGKVLGRSFYKAVHKQKWCGELVAVSTYYHGSSEGMMNVQVSMLVKLQHPNVVQFIGWKFHDISQRELKLDVDQYCAVGYIVTELMEQDLGQLIERNTRLYSRSPFSLLVAIDILLQVVEAMIYIHKCGVIYRDLKPSNILVSPKYTANSKAQDLDVYYTVKLNDFQTAEMWNSSAMPLNSECFFYAKHVGTRLYMAPEVMDKDSDVGYTNSVDAYSFGMTAYQVTTGLTPFESVKQLKELKPQVIRGERPPFPDDYASGLKELIQKCWSGVPKERPSFEQIRKDLWTLKYHESIAQ